MMLAVKAGGGEVLVQRVHFKALHEEYNSKYRYRVQVQAVSTGTNSKYGHKLRVQSFAYHKQ
jgi:hypothetical protein